MLAVKCLMMLFLQNAEKDVMIAQMKTQLDESRLAKTSQHSLHHTTALDDDTTGGNDKTSIYTQTETVSREITVCFVFRTAVVVVICSCTILIGQWPFI